MTGTNDLSSTIHLTMELTGAYEFRVRVDGENAHEFVSGEGPPLGAPGTTSAGEMLGASVATCLASSFLFCAQKAHVRIEKLGADVHVAMARNAQGRVRIRSVSVALDANAPAEQHERIARCREIFEEYCVVTESVRAGIPVDVALRVT